MTTILLTVLLVATIVVAFFLLRLRNSRLQLAIYSITAEELHREFMDGQKPLIYDVRLPLDVLADPTIIAEAQRIAPKELLANPELIPRDRDVVVYCTCPGDETSRNVLRKALALNFRRVKFLRGGLGAWKANGYPVQPYSQPFHLDTL